MRTSSRRKRPAPWRPSARARERHRYPTSHPARNAPPRVSASWNQSPHQRFPTATVANNIIVLYSMLDQRQPRLVQRTQPLLLKRLQTCSHLGAFVWVGFAQIGKLVGVV